MGQMFSGRKRIRKYFSAKSAKFWRNCRTSSRFRKSSYDYVPAQRRRPIQPVDGEGIQGVFQSVFPIKDFNETALLEFVKLRARAAEIRRRRVPAARHDLRRAAEGDAAPDRVRCGRRYRRQVRQGHQGAGRLHGRHAADDEERHVHRQRHGARDRQPDAPLARRVLRPRQGQDAFSSGKLLFASRVIPYRGSWLDFEFDAKDIVFAVSTAAGSCR